MRDIVNISLPKDLNKTAEALMRQDGYATKSELFRDLLRMRIEGRLLRELSESREEIKNGRGRLLNSLKDLR